MIVTLVPEPYPTRVGNPKYAEFIPVVEEFIGGPHDEQRVEVDEPMRPARVANYLRAAIGHVPNAPNKVRVSTSGDGVWLRRK